MRRLLPAAFIVAVVALLFWVFLPSPVPVETARVTRGDLAVHVEAEGEARIREVVVVSTPIAGLLQRITLHSGDDVIAGQTVARIGPVTPALLDSRARAVAEATAAAAAAAVDLARSQVAQAEAMQTYAQIEADRARALFSRGTMAQRVLDDTILALRTAQAALDSARANLAVREKERQSARAVLDGGPTAAVACCVEVSVPSDGRILRVLSEDEQVVPAGTPVMEIGDPQDIEIVAHVLSQDAVGIGAGSGAVITGWGGPDLAAVVERVEPSATTRISALGIEEQRVEVRLSLKDAPPPVLGHGFRVTARIKVDEAQATLRVPVPALFRAGGDWAVYAIVADRAVLRRLSLGVRNDEQAQVLDGLVEGDEVIVFPGDAIDDGVRVAR